MIICDLKLLLFLPCHPCNVIFRAICGFAARCWAPPASQPSPGVAILFPSRGRGRASKWVHLVRAGLCYKEAFPFLLGCIPVGSSSLSHPRAP